MSMPFLNSAQNHKKHYMCPVGKQVRINIPQSTDTENNWKKKGIAKKGFIEQRCDYSQLISIIGTQGLIVKSPLTSSHMQSSQHFDPRSS